MKTKKGLWFLVMFALVAASIVILIYHKYTFLVLLFMPAATWIWLKTDFKTGDENPH